MPVYHARSIAVRLGSLPLTDTTTSNVVLKKGEVAKRQSEVAEKQLLRSGFMNEMRVPFPGDRDSFELNWLGNAPFMQTQVDPGFIQIPGPYASDQMPRASGRNRPQALTLHVKLSDEAFLNGFNAKTHLKIEVLFNGQLSTSSLIHTNDIRSGAKSLHQVFAGYRVDFLAERPWVLLPPFTTADGGVRRFRKTRTPTERWEEVSDAILKEAEERGTDKYGKSPPSAAFLHALASMDMPECVKSMQKPGGRKFGVVDVVITAGFGNKLTTGTNYLKRPQRLKDSNYAVQAEIASGEEAITADVDASHGMSDTVLGEAMLDVSNNGANGQTSDATDKRPRKRRALSSVDALPQALSLKTNSQNPFSSGQVPVLPPPLRSTCKNSLHPTAGSVSPRCPSPEHRSDGHKEPLPASDPKYTYDMAWETKDAKVLESEASRILQEYHFPPHDPELHAMQRGCATLSEGTNTCGTIANLPFVRSTSVSNSLPQALSYSTSPPAPSVFPGTMEALNSTIDVPSNPFVVPTALMLPTPPNWMSAPGTMTSPTYPPLNFLQHPRASSSSYPPGHLSYMHPGGIGIQPQTPPLYGYPHPGQFTASIMSSPPTLQSIGPLPPTAMFSVPLKNKRNSSPGKSIAAFKLVASHSSVLIHRLVITGRSGRPVVDHVWSPPQRVLLDSGDRSDIQRKELSSAGSRATRLLSASTKQHTGEHGRDSVVETAIEMPLPYLKRHQSLYQKATPSHSSIDLPDSIAPFVPAHVLATASPTPRPMPSFMQAYTTTPSSEPHAAQRRTFSRNTVPGIQGPKTAPFLLDDPEEVLREAAKMRRSRSPIKPAVMPPVSQATPQAESKQEVAGTSSPLSSVPSSLDAVADQIPQLDGSPQSTLPALTPRKPQTPSPMKSSYASQKFRNPGLVTPQSSVSPKSKKRKISSRSPNKPPRSPRRLMTVENPPLNDDCVIALAESMDKMEKRGVLRQVKGERQGVFREEYVALAVRFFIAAD